MGILDDAIKEHLELKRSHGASEDEIKRKEAEVFGQVRAEAATAAPAEAPLEEHTQLLTPDEHAAAGLSDLEPLEPAPEDPYAVHPGDELVPDLEAPTADADVPPAAEAGAGTLEPSESETGPPTPPEHHHDDPHPALVDHDHIGGEEHAPEPVFGHRPAEPARPADTDEHAPVVDADAVEEEDV